MKCESGRVQYVFFNESKDIALCEVLRHNEIFKKINFTKSTSKIVDTSVEKESFDNVYNEILNDNI
jgi:hypothetical protein